MMKTKIIYLSLIVIFFLNSATKMTTVQSDKSEIIIGTWIWKTVIDTETNEDLGIDVITMGMTSEVKTEFKKDKTYIESKLRNGSTEYSNVNGEWKIENDEILHLKAKDKWRPSKILILSNDSLLLQMNPKMKLLMMRKK